MFTYSLRYADDGSGSSRRVDFEANDAAGALWFAHREAGRRAAELWCGERKLCTLRRVGTGPDFWEIGPAA